MWGKPQSNRPTVGLTLYQRKEQDQASELRMVAGFWYTQVGNARWTSMAFFDQERPTPLLPAEVCEKFRIRQHRFGIISSL